MSGISQAAIEFSSSPLNGGLAAFYRSLAPSRDRAEGGAIPLAGKTVVIVHPAWHSCGTHHVIVSQLAAYKFLGARTISIAVMDNLLPAPALGGDRASGSRKGNDRLHSREPLFYNAPCRENKSGKAHPDDSRHP